MLGLGNHVLLASLLHASVDAIQAEFRTHGLYSPTLSRTLSLTLFHTLSHSLCDTLSHSLAHSL